MRKQAPARSTLKVRWQRYACTVAHRTLTAHIEAPAFTAYPVTELRT